MNKRIRSIGKSIDDIETMKRSRETMTWDYLPMEVVEEEILWRLPVKSIIRIGSVCKSWYSLIRTRKFISNHLLKSSTLFLRNPATYIDSHILFLNLENANHYLECKLASLSTRNPSFEFLDLGSCNGVVCLVGRHDTSPFILCNPSISRSVLLPVTHLVPLSKPTRSSQRLGFGFVDARNQDYKIVRIVKSSTSKCWAAELYSLNSNSWRLIHDVPNNFKSGKHRKTGCFVNSRLHWIVRHRGKHTNFILVFDLNHETFHHISLPNSLAVFDARPIMLHAFQDSLIVVSHLDRINKRITNIWTMKEYGVEESWKTTTMDELVEYSKSCPPFKYVPSLVLLDK